MEPKSATAILSFILFFPCPLLAQMTHNELMSALTNANHGILRLEHGWDRQASYRALLEQGRTTPDELSSALVEAAETLGADAGPAIPFNVPLDVIAGKFAADSLGDFGTANAIPFLERRMREDGGHGGTTAAWQLVKLGERHPEALERLLEVFRDTTRPEPDNTRYWIYLWVGQMFEGESPQTEYADRIRSFLLEATTFETRETERLDGILCLAIPSYAESPERLRFAARIAAAERAAGQTDGHFAAIEANLRAAGVSVTGTTETDSP